MNKCIVITGPRSSGKTTFLNTLKKLTQGTQISDNISENSFAFQNCTEFTKVICIDEIMARSDFNELKKILASEKLEINKKGKDLFTIDTPFFIVVVNQRFQSELKNLINSLIIELLINE